MELGSVTMSPPYNNDEEDLFPELFSTIDDNISSLMSAVSNEVPTSGPFPNMVTVDDMDEEEIDEIVLLKKLFNEQKKKEEPSYPATITVKKEEQSYPATITVHKLLVNQRATSPSYVSSSSSETVVMPDEHGMGREYHGPNRNAIMAKLNRQKKKKQLSELNEIVEELSSENKVLKANEINLSSQVTSLEAEVEYLKGVLANQSELSGLLKNIKATSLSFHSSIGGSALARQISVPSGNKRRFPPDTTEVTMKQSKITNDRRKSVKVTNPLCLETIQSQPLRYPVRSSRSGTHQRSALYEDAQREKASKGPTGVCLHVRDKKVSLEFCESCSRRADVAFQREEEDELNKEQK